MHKGISAAAAVLIGLLALAGCGGGGDSTIGKAEYTQQIELICNQGHREREELLKEVAAEYERRNRNATAAEQAEEQTANVRKLMAVYRGTTEELADVGFPEQGEKMAEELVETREDAVAKVEADPEGAVPKLSTIFAKGNKIAENFEVASCAN